MSKSTSKPDRVSELRKRMGFPEDASRRMLILLILALPPMLFWRHHVGSRMVSLFRLLAMSALMLLWGAIACLVVAGGDWDLQADLFAVVGEIELGIALIGTAHRAVRWIMYQKGEKLSTRSPGISHFSRIIPNANAERYLDPLLTVAFGLVMCSPLSPLVLHAPGSWFVLCGVALYAIESHMHGIQLDQLDGLLRAEAHEQATSRFYNHSNEPAAASSSTTKVTTGVDSDLQASILRRQQRRSQATGATEVRPALPAPPMPEQSAASEPLKAATFGVASETIFATEEPSPTPHPAAVTPNKITPAAAKEKSDSERAKRNKLGVAIGLAVAIGTMLAPTLKGRPVVLTAPALTQAEHVDPAQLHETADRYYAGTGGVVENKALAVTFYLAAASDGYAPSQLKLGLMYELGQGELKQDAAMAVKLYRQAADQGLAQAQTYLADMYMDGLGVAEDERIAAGWYEKAAEQGDAAAKFALGKLYLLGIGGLPLDTIRGRSLVVDAAKLGNEGAKKFIGSAGK